MKVKTENQRLGGLGANIGGEEWERAQLKKNAARQYAEQVRMQTQAMGLPKKDRKAPIRELTAREKALEFAHHFEIKEISSFDLVRKATEKIFKANIFYFSTLKEGKQHLTVPAAICVVYQVNV